jgi:hypothetical protein
MRPEGRPTSAHRCARVRLRPIQKERCCRCRARDAVHRNSVVNETALDNFLWARQRRFIGACKLIMHLSRCKASRKAIRAGSNERRHDARQEIAVKLQSAQLRSGQPIGNVPAGIDWGAD